MLAYNFRRILLFLFYQYLLAYSLFTCGFSLLLVFCWSALIFLRNDLYFRLENRFSFGFLSVGRPKKIFIHQISPQSTFVRPNYTVF
jgi:hypothetical protein